MEILTGEASNSCYTYKILRNLEFLIPGHYDVFYIFFEIVSEYLEGEIEDEDEFVKFVKGVIKKLENGEVRCEIKKYPLSIILGIKLYLTDEKIKSIFKKIVFLKNLKNESDNVKSSVLVIEDSKIGGKSNKEVA